MKLGVATGSITNAGQRRNGSAKNEKQIGLAFFIASITVGTFWAGYGRSRVWPSGTDFLDA